MTRTNVTKAFNVADGNQPVQAPSPDTNFTLDPVKPSHIVGFIRGNPGSAPATVLITMYVGALQYTAPLFSMDPAVDPTPRIPFDFPIDPLSNPGANQLLVSTVVTGSDGQYILQYGLD
jgi:hypothetical protein